MNKKPAGVYLLAGISALSGAWGLLSSLVFILSWGAQGFSSLAWAPASILLLIAAWKLFNLDPSAFQFWGYFLIARIPADLLSYNWGAVDPASVISGEIVWLGFALLPLAYIWDLRKKGILSAEQKVMENSELQTGLLYSFGGIGVLLLLVAAMVLWVFTHGRWN